MLIREKLRPGSIYPQITQAPVSYIDFLNGYMDYPMVIFPLAASN